MNKTMTPYTLYNTLHSMGLYETLCFLGTTETTYVFLQNGKPCFRNQPSVLGMGSATLWKVGLTFNV